MAASTPTNYIVRAFNLYEALSTKALRPALDGKIVSFSPAEIQIQYGENSYLFIFRFGTLVTFNVKDEDLERQRKKISTVAGPELKTPTQESYQVQIGGTKDLVEYEVVELKQLSISNIRLIALTLGQSVGLEYFEHEADRMLRETLNFFHTVSDKGAAPLRSRILLKFIGSAAAHRQGIISNLAILDPPDETWASPEMQKLFVELQQNFDIDLRFRNLDRKLSLVQDNIEILANLATARRTVVLEFAVVILILIEIVLAITRVI